MRDVLVGIDAGTSVIKSVAFTADGTQVAVAAKPNRYETLPDGGAEQDLARTWGDTAETLRLLGEKVPGLAARVAAVAVTGQGDGTWLIDRDGAPVGPGWLWLDARAARIVDDFRARPEDEKRFARTATGLAACQQGPQLLLMKETMPERLARAATAFHCKDWLYFRLTGERATDPSEGSFTFGDFRARDYSDEVIELLGLADLRRLLPPVVDGTARTAPLSAEAARATGLTEGTPVALGYVDVVCTALGAGLFDRESPVGCTVIGSTGMHMRLVPDADAVRLNAERTGYTMPMPAPGVYAQMQSNMAATLNIDWILSLGADLLSSQGLPRAARDLIPLIDGWIAESRPGALLFQPYVSEAGERGPFIDAQARAGFVGLSFRHRYPDLVRAVIEGLAFAARDCYAAMGPLPDEVRLTGGAARSAALRKILGAVLGARLRSSRREEAGAAGAAMIAAVGIGLYPDMEACAAQWVTPLLDPAEALDANLACAYDRVFPAYAQARQALRRAWATLHSARRH